MGGSDGSNGSFFLDAVPTLALTAYKQIRLPKIVGAGA